MKISLLRGRVAIRLIEEKPSSIIETPDHYWDNERDRAKSQGIKSMASHKGRVLGFGPPALIYEKYELPYMFDVGDVVEFNYHIAHNWSDGQVWEDGEPCMYIAQEHINAVIE